jgi:PKD repeat protein
MEVEVTESAGVTADAGSDQSEEVCPGASALIDLTGSGTGTGTLSYSWDYDNGGGTVDSTEQSPQDVPFGVGTYDVTLTVTDDCGSTTDTMEVEVTESDIVLDLFEFRVKLPSDGADFENWTDMFGYAYGYGTNPTFDSNTFVYDIITGVSGSPKFGFKATGCDTLILEYNWYRGESCTGDWLTGESVASPDPSAEPPSWRPIESAGIYPELNSENSLCNHGGNILKIKVATASDNVIYTIVINRVAD